MNQCTTNCLNHAIRSQNTCNGYADGAYDGCEQRANNDCRVSDPSPASAAVVLAPGRSTIILLDTGVSGTDGPRYEIVATDPTHTVFVVGDGNGGASVFVYDATNTAVAPYLATPRDGLAACGDGSRNSGGTPAHNTITIQ